MVCHHLLGMISIISSSACVGTALRPIGEKGRVERYSSSLGVNKERKGETMGVVGEVMETMPPCRVTYRVGYMYQASPRLGGRWNMTDHLR